MSDRSSDRPELENQSGNSGQEGRSVYQMRGRQPVRDLERYQQLKAQQQKLDRKLDRDQTESLPKSWRSVSQPQSAYTKPNEEEARDDRLKSWVNRFGIAI